MIQVPHEEVVKHHYEQNHQSVSAGDRINKCTEGLCPVYHEYYGSIKVMSADRLPKISWLGIGYPDMANGE